MSGPRWSYLVIIVAGAILGVAIAGVPSQHKDRPLSVTGSGPAANQDLAHPPGTPPAPAPAAAAAAGTAGTAAADAAVQQRFEGVLSAADAPVRAFEAELTAAKTRYASIPTKLQSTADAAAAALDTVTATMAQQAWPPEIQSDVQATADAARTLARFLRTVRSVEWGGLPDWRVRFGTTALPFDIAIRRTREALGTKGP